MPETSTNRNRAWEAGRDFAEAVFQSYASLLFLGNVRAGILIAALTWIDPISATGGLLGVTIATLAALVFGFPRELVRTGLYGVAPLLAGMAITSFRGLAPNTMAVAGVAALLTLLLATLLNDHLNRRYGLGSMSLAFALVSTLILYHAPHPWLGPFPSTAARAFEPLDAFFSSLGAIVFLPIPLAGALLFALIAAGSRALAMLAVIGFAAGVGLFRLMGGEDASITTGMVGFNFMLTAMAVGGIFLVPGPLATLHAIGAVAVTAVLALAAERLLSPSQLPVFAWPFNLATLCWLAVLSLRGFDAFPRLSRPLAGTPESIATQRVLLDRLPSGAGAASFLPRLPVLGEWTITQGIDGEPTHRPPWQHAWDFEVLDEEGFPFRVATAPGSAHAGTASPTAPGALLTDYHCFGAPVIAVADGTVHSVVDGVHDNPPGKANMAANYGNVVILQHGPSLFSVYAHLRHGSVRVRVGDTVPVGHLLGQCGASGRSPRPHLHFHVQIGPHIGSPTLAVQFAEYRVRSQGSQEASYRERGEPRVHDRVQAIATVSGARPSPPLVAGLRWRWAMRAGSKTWTETWTTDHDLWGGIRIQSTIEKTTHAPGSLVTGEDADRVEAYWSVGTRGRTATAWKGQRGDGLHAFFIATSRIPAHVVPGLTWTDRPGADLLSPTWRRVADGLLLPLTGPRPALIRFTVTEDRDQLVIDGRTSNTVYRTCWSSSSQPLSFSVIRGDREVLRAEAIHG